MTLIVMMTSELSCRNVSQCHPSQDYTHLDDHTLSITDLQIIIFGKARQFENWENAKLSFKNVVKLKNTVKDLLFECSHLKEQKSQ